MLSPDPTICDGPLPLGVVSSQEQIKHASFGVYFAAHCWSQLALNVGVVTLQGEWTHAAQLLAWWCSWCQIRNDFTLSAMLSLKVISFSWWVG
jgi:hypothetical protein